MSYILAVKGNDGDARSRSRGVCKATSATLVKKKPVASRKRSPFPLLET